MLSPITCAFALGRQQQHAAGSGAGACACRAARCSASTRSAISDARCSSATEISPGRPLLADHEQRRRDQLDVDLGRGRARCPSPADDPLGRLGVAREQRAGEISREAGAVVPTTRAVLLRSEGGGERERVDRAGALAAELARDHRERPAAEADVVDEQARLARRAGDAPRTRRGRWRPAGRSWSSRAAAGCRRRARARRGTAGPSASASRCAKSGTSGPLRLDGTAATQRTGARQVRTASAAASTSSSSKRPERRPSATSGSQPPSPEAGERAALLGAHVLAELAHLALGVGRHLLDLEHERARAQVQRGLAHQRRVQRAVEARRRADRADAAVDRVGVVELLLQRAHQAAAVGAEGRHRLLLAPAQRGHVRVAVAVVAPVAARRRAPTSCPRARPRPRRRAP